MSKWPVSVCDDQAAAIDRPVLHMASPTHYANLMMRYMVASKLGERLPGLQISAVDMPYWNILHPPIAPRPNEKVCRITSEQHVAFDRIGYLWEKSLKTRFEWHGYGQRMENFPTKDICRKLFQTEQSIGLSTSENSIVCPIRGGEILQAIHPGYTTVPVNFYSDLVEKTGLDPIFMGQTDDNSYVRRLRERFPRAEFLPHMGVLQDFQTIRKAKNISLPVSTFAWLAAWLSEADTVVLPVFGMYNTKLFSLHDLLPIGEASYRFYQFPEQAAVPLEQMEEAHALIDGKWIETKPSTYAPESL